MDSPLYAIVIKTGVCLIIHACSSDYSTDDRTAHATGSIIRAFICALSEAAAEMKKALSQNGKIQPREAAPFHMHFGSSTKTAQRKAAQTSAILGDHTREKLIIRQEKTLEPQARFPSGLFGFYDVSAGYSAPN